MKYKKLTRNITAPLLILTIVLSTVLPSFAQETTSFDIQGIQQEDEAMVENIQNKFDRIVEGKESLVKEDNNATIKSTTDELTEADYEVLKVIEQRKENEKNKLRETENTIDNIISFDLVSYDRENIKKIYYSSPSFFEDFKSGVSFKDVITDDYSWCISGKTKETYNPYIYITIKKDGSRGNMFWKEKPVYLTNEEVKDTLSEITESNTEINDLKYVTLGGSYLDLSMTIAYITTSDNQEYIIPIEKQGELIGLNLKQGFVYTAQEFVNEICRYQPEAPLVNENGEVASGTAVSGTINSKKSCIPLSISAIGILIGFGGILKSRKSSL